MALKKVVIDGKTYMVDADRYAQFDSLRVQLQSAMVGDQRLQGRDAGEALAYLISQLAYTEGQMFEKMYTPMQFREFVPITNEGSWADTIRYELMDWAGVGKRISGAGHDLPSVDVQFGERTFPVVTGGIKYGYNYEEMMKSYFFRKPLPTARQGAALNGAERHLNNVALFGEGNLTGLFNNANVPQGNAPTGTWGSASVTNILADFNTMLYNVLNNTGNNDYPTDVLMAPSAFQFIATKPLDTANASNKTVLTYLQDNNFVTATTGKKLNIRPAFGLNTAGSGSTRRMMAYVKDQNRLKMHIPVEVQFLAPQFFNLATNVPGTYRYSGVEVRYPKSAYYMDNI